METIKSHPILFTGPMVRAILDGRKTQTRRVIGLEDNFKLCPYGQPGDRLWVKETFTVMSVCGGAAQVAYRARLPEGKTLAQTDGGVDIIDLDRDSIKEEQALRFNDCERWQSPRFMPRWASRITLEITKVRVERVQEIGGSDAEDEGFSNQFGDKEIALNDFISIWDSINAKRGFPWSSNPWVWVIEFRRQQ